MKELKLIAKWLLIATVTIFVLWFAWPRACIAAHAASPTVHHAAGTAWDAVADWREPDPAYRPTTYRYVPLRVTFQPHPRAMWGVHWAFGVPIGGIERDSPSVHGWLQATGTRATRLPLETKSCPSRIGSCTFSWEIAAAPDGSASGLELADDSLNVHIHLSEVLPDGAPDEEIADFLRPVVDGGLAGYPEGHLAPEYMRQAVRGGWISIQQIAPVIRP